VCSFVVELDFQIVGTFLLGGGRFKTNHLQFVKCGDVLRS